GRSGPTLRTGGRGRVERAVARVRAVAGVEDVVDGAVGPRRRVAEEPGEVRQLLRVVAKSVEVDVVEVPGQRVADLEHVGAAVDLPGAAPGRRVVADERVVHPLGELV